MNAGRDVERLIASWLVEDAPGRAPDRILDAAGQVIDRTNQRRFVAEWREPMYVTMRGLVAAAVIAAVAIGGAIFFLNGAPNANVGASPTPGASKSASPSPSPDALAQLVAYRAARKAVCEPLTTEILGLFAALPSGATPAEQADSLDQQIGVITREIDQLAAIDAPPVIAEEHAVDVQRHRDALVLIEHVSTLLHDGKQAEADAVDQAIGGLSSLEEEYERQYSLEPCP